MERKEIEESIKLSTLEERVESINKSLIGKQFKLEIKEIKNSIFNYEINTVNKISQEIIASRSVIGKIELLEYISGLEKGLQLVA